MTCVEVFHMSASTMYNILQIGIGEEHMLIVNGAFPLKLQKCQAQNQKKMMKKMTVSVEVPLLALS